MTNEEYITDKLQEMGRYVDDQIPEQHGFVVFGVPVRAGGDDPIA
jgi:hypothetical protein